MKVLFLFITALSICSCDQSSKLKKGQTVNIYVAGCDSIFYCPKEILDPRSMRGAKKDDSAFLQKIIEEVSPLKIRVLIKPLIGSCDGTAETVVNLSRILFNKDIPGVVIKTDSLENKYFNSVSFFEIMKPMSMDLNEPKDEPDDLSKLKIKPESTVTFLLSDNNQIYYYKGAFNGHIIETHYADLSDLIKGFKKQLNKDDMMFLIKVEEKASYKNNIDVLDEMTICDIPAGHWAQVDITKEEIDQIIKSKKSANE